MPNTAAVFVDLGNLFYCIGKRWAGRRLDYEKYLGQISADGTQVFRALAYGTELANEAAAFKEYLKAIGFEPKYRQAKYREGDLTLRADWNVGIALDAVRLIERVNCVIIGSTHPEMITLVKWVKERGVRCIVFGCGINKQLRREADHCIEITEDLLVLEEAKEVAS